MAWGTNGELVQKMYFFSAHIPNVTIALKELVCVIRKMFIQDFNKTSHIFDFKVLLNYYETAYHHIVL